MNKLHRGTCLLVSVFSLLATVPINAQSVSSNTPLFKPTIAWKYGPNDGNRANTIGSASRNDPLPNGTSYLSTGYSPAQIKAAYGLNSITATGKGTIIAIIDAYGSSHIQSDLNKFDTQYGIAATTVHIAYPAGAPIYYSSGWAAETTLDVEWAHAIAPSATIYLIVSPDTAPSNMLSCVDYAVTNLNANVVSMSWGGSEYANEINDDSHFTNINTIFVASTGDHQDTNWPSVSPYV
jgi:subtilase family serine protease